MFWAGICGGLPEGVPVGFSGGVPPCCPSGACPLGALPCMAGGVCPLKMEPFPLSEAVADTAEPFRDLAQS